MASTLVLEDGTGKADASTYVAAQVLRDYAEARGVELAEAGDAGDLLVDIMAVKAMDYIEMHRRRFLGWRFTKVQRLSFPREGIPAEYNGFGYSNEAVNGFENILVPGIEYMPVAPLPQELMDAQCELVMQVKAGIELVVTKTTDSFLKRRKLGPLEREFAQIVGTYTIPTMPRVSALLDPFLKPIAMGAYRA